MARLARPVVEPATSGMARQLGLQGVWCTATRARVDQLVAATSGAGGASGTSVGRAASDGRAASGTES